VATTDNGRGWHLEARGLDRRERKRP